MKTKTVKRFFSMLLVATMVVGACFTTASAAAPDDGQVEPRIHYEYDIDDFTLSAGEVAFTRRYGLGFDVSTEGLNHNAFTLSFYITGDPVKLEVSIMTMENYVDGNYDKVVKTETVYGAGQTSVTFDHLAQGTYVFKWDNVGTGKIAISKAHISSSYSS